MDVNTPKFKLLSGREIPLIGLGTDNIIGTKVKPALDAALAVGYRLIDTAQMYCNEYEIGRALQELLPKHNLKREDVIITSKLHPRNHGTKAREAIEDSLSNLQIDYIDLYLIHWPGTFSHYKEKSLVKLRAASWKALVDAQQEGLIKDIGVSNYTVEHLKELLSNCYNAKPVVNQIEWHPYCHDDEIKQFCDSENILVQGYMPLGSGRLRKLIEESDILTIAEKLNRSWAQVFLRWAVQQKVCVIPKSNNQPHLEQNINLDFEIPEEVMVTLSNRNIFKRVDWDPNTVP